MQYEGSKLSFNYEFPEIRNLDWIDNTYKLPDPTLNQPRYHENCPVGWRTTTIDDVARFLPQLCGLELDQAWRKFRTADITLMDWLPSKQSLPQNSKEYIKMFPMFNFQEPEMYSCLGYCANLHSQTNSKTSQLDILESIMEDPKLEIGDPKTIDPRDPCMGAPPPPPKPRPKVPEHVCCGMGVPPSPPPLSPPPPTLPPTEIPEVLLDSVEDPCKLNKDLDVSSMTDRDWVDFDVMEKYGYKIRPWVRLPTLNFLPIGVDTIIAGEKGYLVVDGGWQPQNKIEGEYDLPMQGQLDKNTYPPQSITCVCNPLLKKVEFVHPFRDRQLNNKMACMEVKLDPDREDGSSMYNIYFVGYNIIPNIKELEDNPREPQTSKAILCRDEVIVAIYNSNVKNWIGSYSRPYVRHFPNIQTNDLAFLNNKIFWVSEWADHGRKIKVQNDAFEPTELKWIPVISCFDFESKEITGFSFCQELYHKKIENCLLMKCNQNLYLVSRATLKNSKVPLGRFEVRLVEYKKGSPKLNFTKIATMPKQQYNYLFQNCYMCIDHIDEPAYQCRGGLSFICFYVPHCGTGVIFDVDECVWSNMDRNPGWDLGKKAKVHPLDLSKNALASCVWEPDFKAL